MNRLLLVCLYILLISSELLAMERLPASSFLPALQHHRDYEIIASNFRHVYQQRKYWFHNQKKISRYYNRLRLLEGSEKESVQTKLGQLYGLFLQAGESKDDYNKLGEDLVLIEEGLTQWEFLGSRSRVSLLEASRQVREIADSLPDGEDLVQQATHLFNEGRRLCSSRFAH